MNELHSVKLATPYISSNRGNSVTARRIKEGLEKLKGINVEVLAYSENHAQGSGFYSDQVIHALHAYRFADFLEQNLLPMPQKLVVTMTGTDHNHDLFDPERRDKVIRCLKAASSIVLFHEAGAQQVKEALPELADRILTIPQGLVVPNEPDVFSSSVENYVKCKKQGNFIFLLPAGIRAVKNIFYSIPLLKKLRVQYPQLHLWIFGPVLEEATYLKLKEFTLTEEWVHYGGEVPFDEMGVVYSHADVLLNTSHSEGQASALLEAMFYQVPILAHDIIGNRVTLNQGDLGALYRTEEQFLEIAERWIRHPEVRMEITKSAKDWVSHTHSLQREIESYVQCYSKALGLKLVL